jgi:hypothetical protein
MKNVLLTDFLTCHQLGQALSIYKENLPANRVNIIQQKVIEPNMGEINRKLGQENDPRYLAYAVVYVFDQTVDADG